MMNSPPLDDPVEDDEIACEVDVYLNDALANDLYVVQYPLRGPHRPYDKDTLKGMRHRPIQRGLEMDFTFPRPDAESKSASAAEYHLDTFRLRSSYVAPRTTYCMGVFQRDDMGQIHSFHLTPVYSTVQMRPSFEHIDRQDSEKKRLDSERQAEANKNPYASEPTSSNSESSQIQVTFQRKESDRIVAARRNTFGYLQAVRDRESWIPLSYIPRDDIRADLIFDRLFYSSSPSSTSSTDILPISNSSSRPAPTPMTILEYLNFVTGTFALPKSDPSKSSVSFKLLKSLPLQDQIRLMMKTAGVLSFQRILELVKQAPSEHSVLMELERVATVIQGRWVVRSDVLFSDQSPVDGVAIPKAMNSILARDYALLQFLDGRIVSRQDLTRIFHLRRTIALSLLKLIGDPIRNKKYPLARWKLKGGPDPDFIHRYPGYETRFDQYWTQRRDAMSLIVSRANLAQSTSSSSSVSSSQNGSSISMSNGSPNHFDHMTTTPSPSSSLQNDALMLSIDQTLLEQTIRKFLEESGIGSVRSIVARLQQMREFSKPSSSTSSTSSSSSSSSSTSSSLSTRFQSVLESAVLTRLRSIGIQVRDDRFILNRESSPELIAYRDIVVKLFRDRETVKRIEFFDAVAAFRFPNDVSGGGDSSSSGQPLPTPSNALYTKILKEFALAKGGVWVLKNGEI